MGQGQKPHILKVNDKQIRPNIKIKHKKTDQTHFILGTRAYDMNHKDRFALGLLSVILGGNMSSRLFIEVREKRGLAYYVRTMVESFHECGYLATSAGVEHKNLELAVATIIGEYKKAAEKGVTEKELQNAKDFLRGKTIMGMEESDEVAVFFLDQEVMKKKILTPTEILAAVDKVTVSDILRVARDIFQKNKLNLAVIGPHGNGRKLEKLFKI